MSDAPVAGETTAEATTEEAEPTRDATEDDGPTRVAIACQGGGGHTAFAAGVLTEILRVIERINTWIDDGHLPDEDFQHVDVHRIEMSDTYHCSTKVDRRPSFIRELRERGEARAAEFLAER